MLEALTVPSINHVLRANTWALDRLRAHVGKTVSLSCPPAELRVTVAETGEIRPAHRDALPVVSITMTPGQLLRGLARDETAWSAAHVAGDVEFAAAIDYVRRNLEWDYEEDLSRIFGDVAAHRLARAARGIDRWARGAALNISRAVAEYATYEKPLVASARAIEAFNRDVDQVRDDAERLEKRLEHLRKRLSDGDVTPGR